MRKAACSSKELWCCAGKQLVSWKPQGADGAEFGTVWVWNPTTCNKPTQWWCQRDRQHPYPVIISYSTATLALTTELSQRSWCTGTSSQSSAGKWLRVLKAMLSGFALETELKRSQRNLQGKSSITTITNLRKTCQLVTSNLKPYQAYQASFQSEWCTSSWYSTAPYQVLFHPIHRSDDVSSRWGGTGPTPPDQRSQLLRGHPALWSANVSCGVWTVWMNFGKAFIPRWIHSNLPVPNQ